MGSDYRQRRGRRAALQFRRRKFSCVVAADRHERDAAVADVGGSDHLPRGLDHDGSFDQKPSGMVWFRVPRHYWISWVTPGRKSNRAVRLRPDMAEAYYNLGMTYLELGDRASALAQSRKLEQLDADLNKKLQGEIAR